MSDATGVIRKTVDLNAGIEPTHVGRLFAVGDSKAHTFRITVTADGFPKNMANYTIKGFFLKPDQQNSIVLNGRVDPSDPSTVEVDLIEACYDNEGLFQILIRATNGSVTSTIFWGHGKITKVIDDDHQETVEALPTYSELLAQIRQLNNTLGSSDALNIIYSLAKPYSNQQTYEVGEFVTYQYQLYQCIEPVTVAGAFDRSKWTATAVTDAIAPPIKTSVQSDGIATFQNEVKDQAAQVTVTLEPIQTGSGDPSPENVRAISGHISAKVIVGGKNLFITLTTAETISKGITFSNDANGIFSISGTSTGSNADSGNRYLYNKQASSGRFKTQIPIKTGQTYTLSIAGVTETPTVRVYFRDGDGANIAYVDSTTGSWTFTATVDSSIEMLMFRVPTNGTTIDVSGPLQFEVGDAATEYETFSGIAKQIAFPDPPGTVYGGTLTVNRDGTGKLVVDRGYYAFNGSEPWEMYNPDTMTGLFYITVTNFAAFTDAYTNNDEVGYLITNQYKQRPYAATTRQAVHGEICFGNPSSGSVKRFFVRNTNYSTAEDFNAGLATNPLQVVFRLNTPITYDLTTEQVGKIILNEGLNNIWSADSITVNYIVDTKAYIDSKDEEIQATIADYSIVKSKANAALAGGTIIRESTGFPWDSGGVLGYNYTCKIPLGGSISGRAVFVSVIAAANNNLGALINALAPFYKVDAEGGYAYLYANTNQYKPTRVKVVII